MASNDFSAQALRIARARSAGRCEGCGQVERFEAHHRLYRGRGGGGTAANCLLLCGFGNSAGCHGLAHSGEGSKWGWAVATGGEPEAAEVHHARFGRVFMTDAGLVLSAVGSACWLHMGSHPDGAAGCRSCTPVGRVLWDFEDEKGWG